MEAFGIVIVIVLAAGAVFWWLRRRSATPVEDEWQLPPEQGEQAHVSPPAPPQILDRESVLRRSRVLDPSKWDDTPDGAGASPAAEAEPGDLPTYFDREYLERKKRGEASPS